MSPKSFAIALLHTLGKPVTPANVKAMVGWQRAEGGHWHNDARYNPLNTTQPAAGAGNTGSQGNIKVYRNWQQGLQATAQTLRNGHYAGILSALGRGNDPGAVAAAIGASPWGTSASLVDSTISGAKAGAVSSGGKSYGLTTTSHTTPARTTTDTSGALVDALLAGGTGHVKGSIHQNLLGHAEALLQSGAYTHTTPAKTTISTSGAAAGNTSAPDAHGGTVMIDGHPVANWIAQEIHWARAHGWKGRINSGYRSDAEQTAIYKSGVRPAAVPKSMGGSGSNHEGTVFPYGAIDVSDAPQLAAILRNKPGGSRLVYAGAKDPVHFSHPHGGGY